LGAALSHTEHRAFMTPFTAADAFYDTHAGAPRVLARGNHSDATWASCVELGGDTTNRVYFERDAHGAVSIDPDVELPLALYSEVESRVVFFVAFDQSIDPSAANLARVALEFRGAGSAWHALPALAELAENCTAHGALVGLRPLGSLPPACDVRVVVRAGFSDITGQTLASDASELALLRTQAAATPLHDAFVEDFASSAFEDADATLGEPHAVWQGGQLALNDNFGGTGGTGGDFDYEVPAGAVLLFDTTQMTIVGGPGFVPVHQQTVVGGVLEVRNLRVGTGATLRAQGPNPLVILASGDVQIDGKIDVSGFSKLSCYQLDTFTVEHGALGNCGGGRGGDGHPVQTVVSPVAGAGCGAYDTPAAGGQGGETGWSLSPSDDTRRGAGGGGGRFGPDVPNPTTGIGVFDQRRIGLDAEKGFNNLLGYGGALNGVGPPVGGAIGASPFVDADLNNNFFGESVDELTGARTLGELIKPWAGAGGGGGGDAISLPAPWPPPPGYHGEIGGAAGGGAGALRVIALGRIRIGASGQIVVRGGAGGGGENELFLNRVGGAGGGGSGGHVILESASTIEFGANPQNQPGILATGGQGGAGAQDLGGAFSNSSGQNETTPALDACPAGYATNGVNPCKGQVNGAGGDGGPGVIQLHLFHGIDDVVLPPGKSLADVCQPPPLCDWGARHLQPSVEMRSRARSKWIPIGLGGFDAASDSFAPSEFEFGGTDPSTGRVLATGGEVDLAPPIVGPSVLANAPTTPYIDHFGLDLVVDGGAWIGTSLAYLLERPYLLRHATILLRSVDTPALHRRFDVVTAQRIDGTSLIALWLDGNGPLLYDFQPGGAIEASLHPTWLRAASNGVLDSLPDGAQIRIAFQATTADANGLPDDGAASAPVYDAAGLNAFSAANELRFVRFDVLLLGGPDGNPSAANTVAPSLDFLRLPWHWSDD
jgi:hypothetical protein